MPTPEELARTIAETPFILPSEAGPTAAWPRDWPRDPLLDDLSRPASLVRLGDQVFNLSAIRYVRLNALLPDPARVVRGVEVNFGNGRTYFEGEEAAVLRRFLEVAAVDLADLSYPPD